MGRQSYGSPMECLGFRMTGDDFSHHHRLREDFRNISVPHLKNQAELIKVMNWLSS